ncbi:adrenocortical dysplasia protein homolog [Pempheris klunzingeri]|uniref:adrenocortical dysplasia protein homolog n=1 Tax=Pempheris klunzingeri TaxID=3127111 RepID=UPI00397F3FAE
MPRPDRGRPSPWIESVILGYGGQAESSRLKAHVIGVGEMSQTQALGSEGPTGLLFLSDGLLQIPAILTASAWELLQEQEDRECFTSLVNSTVCIKDYRLQFHMAPEQTKCRFFLSVGELATTAAGPVKDGTPCCTTLPSIRLKICKTWRALLGQETQDSQQSQCGFDLSELLGEWQHDCLQAVLEDVRERLGIAGRHPVSLQPSTSMPASSPTHSDTFTATSWDVDRVRCKGVKCFTAPIKCLLISEEDARQLQTPQNAGSRSPSGLCAAKAIGAAVCKPPDTPQPSVGDAGRQIATAAVTVTDGDASENPPLPVEDSLLHADVITGMVDSDIRTLSNPWDIFPPPCDTSSSPDASPEAKPASSTHNPTDAESKHDRAAILTSVQHPVHGSKESWKTLEHSKEEHSYLLPYQKPPQSTSLPVTAGPSTSVSQEPFIRLLNLLPATDEDCTDTAQLNPLALDQEGQSLDKDTEKIVERRYRKRKSSEPAPGELTTLADEEEQEAWITGSPPSWLFDSPAEEGSSSGRQGRTVGSALRKTPTVHSDGRLFSYFYQVSGNNLQDFSRFSVSDSLLHWAVRYLVVPKQTDNPLINTSVTSNQTSSDRTDVTSL